MMLALLSESAKQVRRLRKIGQVPAVRHTCVRLSNVRK